MEILEKGYCVMECGEEELEECQKESYNSKLNDLDDLIKLAVLGARSNRNEDVGADSLRDLAEPSLNPNICSQPFANGPQPRPLVVLNPATLNQIATSNGYRVASCSASRASPSLASGHSLPPASPHFMHIQQRSATKSASAPPPGLITLSDLLNSSAQSPSPLCQGPRSRTSFPTPSVPRAVHISQTPSPTIVPQKRVESPQVRVRAPVAHTPGFTNHFQPCPPPTCSQVRASTPSVNTSGLGQSTGPRVRLPVIPPKFPETLKPNDPPFQKAPPMSSELQRNFETCDTRSNTTSSLPPPDMPLLPETRPEAASDCRPRRRPGPASRTHRLPSVPSSPDSRASSDMVDLTEDDQPESASKKTPMKEKTFPSLIVTARASLKIFSTALVNNERLLMDNQIRKVMQLPASLFTEHLLQQRLLKAEQFCKDHHKLLKLGMYSDPKRFPVSGGYVWIADCCKLGFGSVYAGSIFDKTLQSPTNIVKLMYHWACNTAVHNVLNWVKVDSYVMKTYYTFFRAVCTAVLHQKFPLLGGSFKKIQVGVISIGTYPEISAKEVKVDIMAVMDPDIPSIRLKVLENFLSDSNKVYESKFRKILEVLKDWVHPQSTIITDFAVDLALCREYGFSNIVVSGGRHSANNNNGVMDYMRAKIPVMLQDTLGLLSYTIIQQFLDELVWRETWGPFPSRAFESLVAHLAELTKLPGPDLITKLKSVAADPNRDWKYSVWTDPGAPKRNPSDPGESSELEQLVPAKPKPKPPRNTVPMEETKDERPSESVDRPMNPIDPAVAVECQQIKGHDKIFLDPFYYGVVDGDPTRQKRSGSFLAECVLCKRDFLSASSFTNHLIHHALNRNLKVAPSKLLDVCPICCQVVRDVNRHRKENHPYPASSELRYMCKICRLDLETEEKIVKHMTLVHQELDMPYRCDLCCFQTSIYDTAVSHFNDFHDKDCCVRCPYCLKIVRFCARNGTEMTNNQYYFVQHVQKHSVKKLNRKCEKCVLSFTNMATLKQHQEKVHKRSGRFLKNVRRLKLETSKMLVMSFPRVQPLPPVTLNENSFHTLKGKALSSSVVLPEYYAVCSCLECDGPMTQNHFSVKMHCTRCNFKSCCANSIREHSARWHFIANSETEQSLRSHIIGGSASLENPLYCSYCPFFSSNGNTMAAHLERCGDGRASAVPDKAPVPRRPVPEAVVPPRKIKKTGSSYICS